MRPAIPTRLSAALACCLLLPTTGNAADNDERARIEAVVAHAIGPLMEHAGVPGMAVGVSCAGHAYIFNYGLASKATGQPVTNDTLFEIGSVSKTFTATLAAYAQATGQLSLADPASRYLPALRGTHFDQVSLVNLGTHTPGGLPMQVPAEVTNDEQLLRYFQEWKPTHAPGTFRTYSNLSIGLLGMIAARSLHGDFATLMEGKLFPALGLKNTFLQIPAARMHDYAQGYTEADAPIRMAPDVLAAETYGVKTTAADLLRFVEVNMHAAYPADMKWQSAVAGTHVGYYQIGGMTQDLIWEQYPDPTPLADLLAGNSAKVISEANPATRLDPPSPPRDDVLLNKTGSTNGFSAYAAFVPARKTGVVLLANKSYPIAARVTAAYEILTGQAAPQP